jgi:hypothetical protein
MNLDELMAVWRTQDAAPLHDVNRTLLHLALRQDEAKLQKARRRERWMVYVFGAGIVAGMALFLALMIYHRRATGWDFALMLVSVTAALVTVRALYMNHRTQSRREQSFGQSLRDQINRSIAQLDDQATTVRRTNVLTTVLMGGICPAAILIFGWRINQKSISDDGYMLVSLIVICVWCVVSGIGTLRRQVQQDILPRRRRLEELLKELDNE